MSITTWLALLIVAGEWTGLARGILGAPYYAAILDVAAIALFSVTSIRAAREGRLWPLPLIAVLVGAYMLLAAVQILNPNVPTVLVGLEGYRKTAFTMLAFFIVLLERRGDARQFFTVVAIGSVPALLWAIRQSFAPLPIDLAIIETTSASPISFHSGAVLRAFSPTAGPFHLGILSAILIIVALVQWRLGSRWWLALAVLAGVALGMTITRANIVAAAAGLLAVGVLAAGWRERFRFAAGAAPAMAAVLVASLIAIGAVGPAPGAEDPGATPGQDVGEVVGGVTNPLADRSLQFRFGYWREYVEAIAERPIVGYGTSAAADGFDHYYTDARHVNFEPHSLYFKAALELGIGGFILFAALLVACAVACLRSVSSDQRVGLIASGALVVVGVSGVTGPMLDAYPVNLLFWATMGWAARQVWTERRLADAEAAEA
jgi:O-antigen ligase